MQAGALVGSGTNFPSMHVATILFSIVSSELSHTNEAFSPSTYGADEVPLFNVAPVLVGVEHSANQYFRSM